MVSSTNFKSLVTFFLINVFAFIVHFNLDNYLGYPSNTTVINISVSYLINAFLSLSICVSVFFLNNKFQEQIGFIFLGLSLVKMILLFFVLNPTNSLGEVETKDAFSLFIPFVLNLIMEQVFIVKLLKISDLAKVLKKD